MAKNFDLSLPLGILPELRNQSPELFQDFVDIHNDLLNIAQAIEEAGAGIEVGGEDISPADWANWPMTFLHKMLCTCGEAIAVNEPVYMNSSNMKIYRYYRGVDQAWSYNPPIFATVDQGSDCFAVALEDGNPGDIIEVTLYGAFNRPDIVEMALYAPGPQLTQLAPVPGAADAPVFTTTFTPEAGNIATRNIQGTGASNGLGYYLGNKWVMVTGGKWSP